MGAAIGRFANRIAGGRFAIGEAVHRVPANNGANALHGGPQGFDKALWEVVMVESGAEAASVTMRHVSPDGDMGFPGRLEALATYRLGLDRTLSIDFFGTTDRPTLVNLTNHNYWNLAGVGSGRDAMDHILTIHADRYLPVDADAIPTGELAPVEGTPFDFRMGRRIGLSVRDARHLQIGMARGYDHHMVMGDAASDETRLVASAQDPASGRAFDLWSNQPGLQLYSANYFDGTVVGKGGQLLRMGDAFALEPQRFPDAPNHPHFPSARLDPGQSYRNRILYRFRVEG
jgi:aldose 1-epimerase